MGARRNFLESWPFLFIQFCEKFEFRNLVEIEKGRSVTNDDSFRH